MKSMFARETALPCATQRHLGAGLMAVLLCCTPADQSEQPPAHPSSASAQTAAASPLTTPVESLMAAFNAHDPVAMTQQVAPDIVWSSIDRESMAIEATGSEALLAGMRGYFHDLPSVRSEIEDMHVSGSYVTVGERVHWQTESGPRTQRSLAVYHIEDELIQSVWYFPAEP